MAFAGSEAPGSPQELLVHFLADKPGLFDHVETVAVETPTRFATSCMVAMPLSLPQVKKLKPPNV